MPTLAAPAGATPSLLTVLTPVSASPIAPVDGGAAPSFADIVAGLTAPPELPPLPLPTGQALPVERPNLAVGAPDAMPEIDGLVNGCGWTPEPPADYPNIPFLPVPASFKPIARFDPAPTAEPDLATPVREVARLPLRADVPVAPPVAMLASPVLPTPASPRLMKLASSETPPEAAEPDAEILPEALPVPLPSIELTPLPVAMPIPGPEPATSGTEPTTAAVSVAATPAALPAGRPILPAKLEEQSAAHPQAQPQTGGDSQPEGQAQPQSRTKPLPNPTAPAELRIAPELARQVAQMIQPALERASEPAAMTMPGEPTPLPILTPAPIAAPAPAQPSAPMLGAPVDLGRAGWVEAMIERIADMPQVDRREAQIKLLPDMLGKVEVTLVERDQRVHVTLNADTVQARQMLAEAAPRLQELAEARGLRLGQTEIGGGTSQDRRAPHDQNQPQTSLHPRSAQAEQADDQSTADGDRIA